MAFCEAAFSIIRGTKTFSEVVMLIIVCLLLYIFQLVYLLRLVVFLATIECL